MWTAKNRKNYDRSKQRYPSDLTDAEWALVEPHIPPARKGGRKRAADMREVVNAIMYVLSTGCQWSYLPRDFPARSTVFDYFNLWMQRGVLEKIHLSLFAQCREKAGRKREPTACVLDAQSVKSAEKGGSASMRMATMLASRSKARRGTSSST
jgi:transposase